AHAHEDAPLALALVHLEPPRRLFALALALEDALATCRELRLDRLGLVERGGQRLAPSLALASPRGRVVRCGGALQLVVRFMERRRRGLGGGKRLGLGAALAEEAEDQRPQPREESERLRLRPGLVGVGPGQERA